MKTILVIMMLVVFTCPVYSGDQNVCKQNTQKIEELEKRVKYLEDRIGRYYGGNETDVMIQERQLRNNPGYRLPKEQDASTIMSGEHKQ